MGHLGQVSEKKSVERKDMISWHDLQAGSNAMLLTGFENKKKVMDGWHMLAANTNQTAVKPWFLLSQIRYQDHPFPIFSGLRAPISTFTTSHSWKIIKQTILKVQS